MIRPYYYDSFRSFVNDSSNYTFASADGIDANQYSLKFLMFGNVLLYFCIFVDFILFLVATNDILLFNMVSKTQQEDLSSWCDRSGTPIY
jgi:hypothetical protein